MNGADDVLFCGEDMPPPDSAPITELLIPAWSGMMKTHVFKDGSKVVLNKMFAIQKDRGYVIRICKGKVSLLPIITPPGPWGW